MAAEKLNLELPDPTKKGDLFDQRALAVYAGRQGRAEGGVSIQFYLDLASHGSPVETDENGRAEVVFENISAGKHFFEAQIVDSTKRARQTKVLGEETKGKAELTFKQGGKKPN